MGHTCCLVLLVAYMVASVVASPSRSSYNVDVARELLARLEKLEAESLLFDKATLADCTKDDEWYCVSYWPVDYCVYSNVPGDCPAMCGTCKKKLPASSSDTCPEYDNSYCGDPLLPENCAATSFVPNACPAMCGLCKPKLPVCTKDDDPFKCVSTWTVDQCTTDSVAKACPAMCSLCMKKLPESTSDECPEYDNGYCGTELSSADCTKSAFIPRACPAMCGRCKKKAAPILADCTKDDAWYCVTQWPVDYCVYSNVQGDCPAMCGNCKKKLPASSSDMCPEYDNSYCGDPLLPGYCKKAYFVSNACPAMCGLCKKRPPVCTQDDALKCGGTWTVDQCTTDSVAKTCPAMCGLCMKKLPASPSDECPEYDNGYCGNEFSSADCTKSAFVPLACPAMCGRCKKKGATILADCSKDDASNCNQAVFVDSCSQDSGIRDSCPAMCGLCKKKLPALQTGDCPEYDNWYCGDPWLASDCKRYSYVSAACPGMCGLCKKRAPPNDDGNNTPGDVAVQMPACDAKYKALTDHTMCRNPSPLLVPGGKVYDGQKQIIINLHNKLRAKPYPQDPTVFGSAMQAMVWDDNIAIVAQKLAETCVWGHDHDRSVIGYSDSVGQNLARGYGNWETAIEGGWYGEVTDFVYGKGSKDGVAVVGHYTALVKDSSARIGCGYALCKNTDNSGTWPYYVCNYAKIQSDVTKPFVIGPQCGQCPSKCNAGLCDCKGKICEHGADINLDTCACKCPDLWNGSPRCTVLSCPDRDDGYCGNDGWKQTDCGSSYIRDKCPYLCGLCKMPTASSPSADCPKQDNVYCGNLVPQSDCATYASSACPGMCGLCKKLPPDCTDDDKSKCFDGWTVGQCSDATVASACPAMCGNCMKRLPKLTTDECPDYDNWYCNGIALTTSDCATKSYVPRACPAMCGLCKTKPFPVLSDCTIDDAWYCVTQWPVGYCKMYSNVPGVCPAMCNTCKKKLPASSSSPCPGKDNPYCGVPNGWLKTDCSKFYYVRNSCPGMCGLCLPIA